MKQRSFPANKHIVALLLAGVVLLCGPAASAQVADSLARLLAKAPADTNRVLLLTDLAWEINETETDKADRLLQEAVALAQRLKFPRGEAAAWNGLGVVEELRGNKDLARQLYRKALQMRQKIGHKADIASSLNNLGVLFEELGQPDSAIAYHKQNLAIQETLKDTLRIARARFNIASALQEAGDYTDARNQLYDARTILEAVNNRDGIAKVFTQLGHIYLELDRYKEALPWYRQALEIRETLDDPTRLAMALSDYANALDEYTANFDSIPPDVFFVIDRPELSRKRSKPGDADTVLMYYQRALDIWEALGDEGEKAKVLANFGDVFKRTGEYGKALEYLRQAEAICLKIEDQRTLMEIYNTQSDVYDRMGNQKKALQLVHKYYMIARETKNQKLTQGALKDFSEVYAAMRNYPKAYEFRKKYDEFRYARLKEKERSDFSRKEVLYETERREKQLKEQEAAFKLQESELARSRTEFYASLAGALALLILAALLFSRNRLRARANRELAAKNNAIEQERRRADDLLANILPAATAAELKAHARVKPVRYESVTVMFTDFKGFTTIAETMPSEILIAELDECFSLFDGIMQEFGLEKIKTIGDAYMCAGGLPTPNDTHPQDVVRAAIAMQCRLQDLMQQKKAAGQPFFEMRIGIHTGPVVAGVVGRHKFAYDIWGDTVNTAARLEQGGEPLKVNISETTYQAVKDLFPCTYRGRLSAKNKGEVAMYFVEYEYGTGTSKLK
jgi:class 3 adenylate cyclase/Tfp pilus assembly protein PilF